PLKSALKMSRSTSNSPLTSPLPQYTSFSAAGRPIQRTKSAPAVGTYEPGPSSIPLPSPTAKSVRFPTDETTLERICTFRKHGKPIHVSTPVSGDETATETEGESSSASYFRNEGFVGLGLTLPQRERGLATHRPKPPLSSLRALVTSLPIINPPLAPTTKGETPLYEVDTAISSPIPSPAFDSTANVHLESLSCSSTDELQTSLSGDILVRNLSYSKNVTVRFTLDDWATISNVSAQYVESLPSFPTSFFQVHGRPVTTGDAAGFLSLVDQKEGGWDRFRFTIVFEHGAYSLSSRVLLMAARYAVDGKEWWDNNGGENYRIAF
ncbi:putative phosphatase regulatory subunit-domain-containing protein, partial [Ephemerocybe angulata]